MVTGSSEISCTRTANIPSTHLQAKVIQIVQGALKREVTVLTANEAAAADLDAMSKKAVGRLALVSQSVISTSEVAHSKEK